MSIFLRMRVSYSRWCNKLCTSGFVDDVMLSHSGACGRKSGTADVPGTYNLSQISNVLSRVVTLFDIVVVYSGSKLRPGE